MSQNPDTVPVITKTAFSCPHCGAYTTQHWSRLFTDPFGEDYRTPHIPDSSVRERFENDKKIDSKTREHLLDWVDKMSAGKPFFETQENPYYSRNLLLNVNISCCYNCKEISIWCHDQIVYPNNKVDILPNQDLPAHIQKLFEEAREIVGASPRGAAALLRLSIQHLCKELGESGENIDKDIASLVTKGLNPLVQKSLDVVRVIGNEAVHPGEIDLNDNRDTALKLFGLVNLISDQMVTHPKQVEALYAGLPESKLKGIEDRNKKAQKKST